MISSKHSKNALADSVYQYMSKMPGRTFVADKLVEAFRATPLEIDQALKVLLARGVLTTVSMPPQGGAYSARVKPTSCEVAHGGELSGWESALRSRMKLCEQTRR